MLPYLLPVELVVVICLAKKRKGKEDGEEEKK
jgi:hypothetical protein